jgi:iron complex transport system ATP-binding protein
MIAVHDLRAGYGGRDVIQRVSFTAGRGQILCILGPNGCGKSTLLKSLARIIGYRGTVTLDGADISSFPRRELAKKIALLGQTAQIYFPYTVYETVSLGRYAYGGGFLKGLSPKDKGIIAETIKKLDLEDVQTRMINELSGGQLQRVFLAKTLVQNPEVILLDEPTNHLDLKHQAELLRSMKQWAAEHNRIVIGVLHDLNLARYFGDQAALLCEGTLAAQGQPEAVLNSRSLQLAYGMDIRQFMLESLEKWRSLSIDPA